MSLEAKKVFGTVIRGSGRKTFENRLDTQGCIVFGGESNRRLIRDYKEPSIILDCGEETEAEEEERISNKFNFYMLSYILLSNRNIIINSLLQ